MLSDGEPQVASLLCGESTATPSLRDMLLRRADVDNAKKASWVTEETDDEESPKR